MFYLDRDLSVLALVCIRLKYIGLISDVPNVAMECMGGYCKSLCTLSLLDKKD